jgi:hypothetical protein
MTLVKHTEMIGKRVKLIFMEDSNPIEPGTMGTIQNVDDMNYYSVLWDNGRVLNLLPDEDKYEIVD